MNRALRHRSFAVGGGIVVFVLLVALIGPAVSTHDPMAQASVDWPQPPSWEHPLGTDELGRDLLARVLHGARRSGGVAIRAVLLALLIGVPLGAAAGYFGGRTDQVLMRIVDVWMAFPGLLLAMVLMTMLTRTPGNVALAVGLVGVPLVARQVRASVQAERVRDYVAASNALGAGHLRLLVTGIGPNCVGPVLVLGTLGLATAVLDAAGLAFLGLAGEPDIPEWGRMLASGMQFYETAPWLILAPGAALSLTVLGFNLLGDGLRDLLDPKQRG